MNVPLRPNRLSFLNHDLRSSLLSSEGHRGSLIRNNKSKKILIMGYNQTGKSSLALKFLYNHPDATNLGTEENYYTQIKYKNENFMLHLVDFAGIDEYTPIYASKFGLKVDGYILVFSVDNRKSFEFIQELRDKLKSINGRDVPSLLVANKCDLKHSRQVSTEEGKKLSKALGIPYLEVSAERHSTEVIKKVFEVILRETVKDEQQENDLKRLKNWDEEKVEQLYRLFLFASILLALIGIFFVVFGIFNMLLYPTLIQTQGVALVLLILNGFILITLAILGSYGMTKQESDCISVFMVLVVLSSLLNIGCGVMRIFFNDSNKLPQGVAGKSMQLPGILDLNPLVYAVMGILLVLLLFLFCVSSLSNEIFIKKKRATKNRYATLAV